MIHKDKTKDVLLNELAEMRRKVARLEKIQIELNESKEKYEKLLETANDAIFIADADTGIIIDANKKAGELLGIPLENIIGMHQTQLHPEEEAERYRKIFKEHIRDKRAISEDVFIVNKNGRKVPVEISASFTEIAGKNIIQGIFRDITKRRKAEERIRSSEERLKILFEYTPEAVYLTDLKGNFQEVNKAAERLSGYWKDELIGKNFQELNLIKLKQVPTILFLLAESAMGKPTGPSEFTLVRKNGTHAEIEIMSYPVIVDKKKMVLGIAHDITGRKVAARGLEASLREKEVLLQELSHRTKNNMQIVSSLLNLQSVTIKDIEAQQIFKEIRNRIRSISLVHEKLYRSKDLYNINFKEYIEELTDNLIASYVIDTNGISLKMDISNIYLSLDTAISCGLIINELMTNIFKYAFPDGKGGIELNFNKTDKGQMELSISDDGIGMPENFDLKKTNTLGLKLVNKLVKNELAGEIELKTENGTGFLIKFKDAQKRCSV